MGFLSIILIIVLSLALILLVRDMSKIKQVLSKGNGSIPLTPLGKDLYQMIQASIIMPSLLGRANFNTEESVTVSKMVLDELVVELKQELGYECLMSSADDFSSTDSKLTSAYLSFVEFLNLSSDSLKWPINTESNSVAAFGILASLGFNFVYIDKLKKVINGFVVIASPKPIEVSKVKNFLGSIQNEIPLRQKLHDLQVELESLSQRSSFLQRKIASLAHDAKSPVQALNLILSQVSDQQSKELLDLGKVSLSFLNDLLAEFNSTSEGSKETINFYEMIKDIKALLTPVLHFKSKELNIEVDPNFRITGYPNEIRRILLNLLSNSIKHGQGEIKLYQVGSSIFIEDYQSNIDDELFSYLNKEKLLELYSKGEKLPSAQGWGYGILNVVTLCDKNSIDCRFFRNERNGLKVELVFPQLD